MAADDVIYSPKAQITRITGSATRASGTFSTSGEVTALSANAYQVGDAVLSCSFSTAPTEGDLVHLYIRPLNIDGSNNATIPEDGYEHIFVGSFSVKDTTAQQYIKLPGIPLLEGDQQFYIKNDTDQTMDSDYVVKVTPVPTNTQ